MEAYTEGQGDVKGMFCAITLQVATVMKEVLQAGLHVDAKMGRDVVLNADTEGCGPLAGNVERGFLAKGNDVVGDMLDVERAPNGEFQHDTSRGVEAEVCLVIPLPTESERDTEIVQSLAFLNVGCRASCRNCGFHLRIAETRFDGKPRGELTAQS